MLFKASLLLVAAASSVLGQRPSNTSICDYYTTALLKDNNATNQYTLLTLVVNTAVIGNYTKPNVGIMVPGILAPGMYNGTEVNLAGYFNGGLASTNNGGSMGVSQNFLDDGGAVPLMMDKPANGTMSNQYKLLTHLYEYFGVLLGCSMVGSNGFPAYGGSTNMYDVHKYMGLDPFQMGYFITQVGLSAASFGVTNDDVMAVGMSLTSAFDKRCSAATSIPPSAPPALQAMCIASSCPIADNATCSAYGNVTMPAVANATLAGNTTSSGSGGAGSGSSSGAGSGSSSGSGSSGSGSSGAGSGSSGSGSSTASAGSSSSTKKSEGVRNYGSTVFFIGAAALAFALSAGD